MVVDTWQGLRLEEIERCPVCGWKRGDLLYTFGFFGVHSCLGCGAGHLSPRVVEDDIVKIYQNPSYFSSDSSFGYLNYESQEDGLRKSFALLVKRLKKWGRAKGTLLEIGCGPGLFLQEAQGSFEHMIGLDLSEDALKRASMYADRVVVGGIDALQEGEQFDLVVAISLIEHVYSPGKFLRNILGHLKEGGAILFVTPDFGGIWHRFLGRRWPSFKIPEHVVFYTRRSLRYLGDTCGLDTSFFAFTQFAPVSLVLNSLGAAKVMDIMGLDLSFNLPVPHTMLAVLYERH